MAAVVHSRARRRGARRPSQPRRHRERTAVQPWPRSAGVALRGLSPASRRRAAMLSVVVLVAFGGFFQSVHLGYEIGDAEAGVFRSRYTAAELAAVGQERAARWKANPPMTWSRLSQEDQYMTEGWPTCSAAIRCGSAGNVLAARHENLILERYYAPVLDSPSYVSPTGPPLDARAAGRRRVPRPWLHDLCQRRLHLSGLHLAQMGVLAGDCGGRCLHLAHALAPRVALRDRPPGRARPPSKADFGGSMVRRVSLTGLAALAALVALVAPPCRAQPGAGPVGPRQARPRHPRAGHRARHAQRHQPVELHGGAQLHAGSRRRRSTCRR